MSYKRFTLAMIAPSWGTAYWWALAVPLVMLAGTLGMAYAVF